VAIGVFSLFFSTTEILIAIAVFTGVSETKPISFDPQSKEVITYELYIAHAAMNFVIIIFSILLLYGNERTNESRARSYYLPWLILIPFYVIYEAAINIFYFYNQFNHMYEEPLKSGSAIGYNIVPLVYCTIKDILLFISFVFLIIRFQSLSPVKIQYVQEDLGGCHDVYAAGPTMGSCHDAYAGPAMRTPVVFPLPAPSRPALPACTSCSGGCLESNKCGKCNLPQPMYGYAGATTANAGKTGWTTSIYSR
jgi:hypothetical protein